MYYKKRQLVLHYSFVLLEQPFALFPKSLSDVEVKSSCSCQNNDNIQHSCSQRGDICSAGYWIMPELEAASCGKDKLYLLSRLRINYIQYFVDCHSDSSSILLLGSACQLLRQNKPSGKSLAIVTFGNTPKFAVMLNQMDTIQSIPTELQVLKATKRTNISQLYTAQIITDKNCNAVQLAGDEPH